MLENLIIAHYHYHICNKNFAHECIVICRVSEHNNAWNRKLCNKEIDPQSALLNWSIFPVSGKWGDFVNQYYYFFFFNTSDFNLYYKVQEAKKIYSLHPLRKVQCREPKNATVCWSIVRLCLKWFEAPVVGFGDIPLFLLKLAI